MNPDDPEHRSLRAAFQALEGRAAAPAPCPSPEQIWDAAHGKPDPAAVADIVDHTVVCAECAEAWRLAMALERPAGKVLVMPERRTTQRRWLLRAAGVAAVAAVVAVALPRLWAPAPEYRRGQEVEIHSRLPADSSLPRDRFLLRWSEVPDAESYELEVTSEDLRLLERAGELEEPRHLVPGGSLSGLPEGARVYWRVTAVLGDGTRVASPTFSVQLRISSHDR